jgi:predicted DNA-binding transcriptional regulator AlpA
MLYMTAKKPDPALDSPLMTIGEVCAYVRTGESKIRDLIQLGDFPEPIRIGSRVFWLRKDIESWLHFRPTSK